MYLLVTTLTNLRTFIYAAVILLFSFFVSIQDSCPYNSIGLRMVMWIRSTVIFSLVSDMPRILTFRCYLSTTITCVCVYPWKRVRYHIPCKSGPNHKLPRDIYSSFLFLIFPHFYVGSMCLMRLLHLARSCVSSLDNYFSDKSFPMVSIHLRFGLPLLLFPGTSIPVTLLPTYSSSLLNTCPYHFNLLSCTFLDISPTFVVPLILSFLILSSVVEVVTSDMFHPS